jgi:hypothetical protein
MPLLTEAAISAGILRRRAAQLRQQHHSNDLLRQFPSAAAIVPTIAASIPIQRTLLQNTNPRSALAQLLDQPAHSLLAEFDAWADGAAGVPAYLPPPVQDMFMSAGSAALAVVLPGSQQHLADDMYDFMQHYQ